jgi:probable phosphoglycerate mutase
LNEMGREQAVEVAKRLASENWDLFYSSDLIRTKETAEIIATAIPRPAIQYDERLREISMGRMEGTTAEERSQQWGADWASLEWGVESNEAVRERGVAFVEEMVANHAGKKILVVSHGAILRQLFEELIPKGERGILFNTSVSTIIKQNNEWTFECYNCTKHLGPLLQEGGPVHDPERSHL